jgi:hypothetical protein
MTNYLLFFLFVGTLGSRALGLDLGVAPGISVKNILLYVAVALVAVEAAIRRDRKFELPYIFVPFGALILYAALTWLIIILFVENPYYFPRETLIRLKTKLIDQYLMFAVFFFGATGWQQALRLLRGLIGVVAFGCLITIVDTFNIPDLGIITARSSDGRIEGFTGDAQDFGGLLAFVVPLMVAKWWTATGKRRFVALLAIPTSLVCIFLSASRGAMLGSVAGALIAAVYLRRYLAPGVVARAAAFAIALITLSAIFVISTEFGQVLTERITKGVGSGSLQSLSSGRTAIWSAAWREMAEYPLSFITGMGWESYYQKSGYRFATHSVYLDRIYNLGIIGLGLYILPFLNTISTARRAIESAPTEVSAMLLATIMGLLSFMIAMAFSDIHGAALYVWAFCGLAMRIAVQMPVVTATSASLTSTGQIQPLYPHPRHLSERR